MKNKSRPELRKYHYIYKITRDDGKYYIGLHSTDDLDDGYFGSGQALWHSIRAHGKEKHTKTILEFCDSRKSLIEREEVLVSEDVVNDRKSLNLRKGGSYLYRKPDKVEGGKRKSEALRKFYDDKEKSASARQKIRDANAGKNLSEDHKKILSETLKSTVARLKEAGDWERVVEMNRLAHLGKTQTKDTIEKRNASIKKTKLEKYGGKYTFSAEARKNIANSQLGNEKHAKTWKVSLNTGETLMIKNITKWYRETGNIHRGDGVTLKNSAGVIIGQREKIEGTV